jgi:methyltransferase (TIGR00027 family)
MPEAVVTHISDTAIWVAEYRARETERPDAIFRDPLAKKLAGSRGKQMADKLSTTMPRGWPVVVRTKLIDDLVLKSIAEGADLVINLAAGLDTRPYRLALPSTLTWVEADLPGLVEEKERLLRDEKPVCRLVREKVDLANTSERSAFLDRALDGAQRALVITEGLLAYLHEAEVQAIARDLRARPQIAWWMIDLASPAILHSMQKRVNPQLQNIELRFGPANGTAFFRPLGWNARDIESFFRAALRYNRVPWYMRLLAFFPDPNPEDLGQKRPWGAIIRFDK